MVGALQKINDQNEENGSNAIFRTYDRVKELKQHLDRFTFRYYVIGAFAIGTLAFSTSNSATRILLDLISVGLFISL